MTPSSQVTVAEERQNDITVERVLRQAQISRLTQNLRSRLQLATLKTQGQSPQAQRSASSIHASMSPPLDPDSRFALPATPQSIARQRPYQSPSPVKRSASLAAGATFDRSGGGGGGGPSGAAVAAAAAARRPKALTPLPLRKRARTLEGQNQETMRAPPMMMPHSLSTPSMPQLSIPPPTSAVPPSVQAAMTNSGVPTPPTSAQLARNIHIPEESARAPIQFSPQAQPPFPIHRQSPGMVQDPRKDAEPHTPPPQQARRPGTQHLRPSQAQAPRTPGRNTQDNDGANLLLYLATSPGRPGMTPRTPHTPQTPDFNLNDYLHLYSPSPKAPPNRDNRLAGLGRINQLNQDIFAGMEQGPAS